MRYLCEKNKSGKIYLKVAIFVMLTILSCVKYQQIEKKAGLHLVYYYFVKIPCCDPEMSPFNLIGSQPLLSILKLLPTSRSASGGSTLL